MNKYTLIIFLLVLNLGATVWFGTQSRDYSATTKTPIEQTAKHKLPEIISDAVKSRLIADFTNYYNADDYDAIYNMLGDTAKAQIKRDDAVQQFRQLKAFFTSISGGTFDFSQYLGSKGSISYYTLHYIVDAPENAFSPQAVVQINIAVDGSSYQVYGARLHTN